MSRSNIDMLKLYFNESSYTEGLGLSYSWSPIKITCCVCEESDVTMCASNTSAASSTIIIGNYISLSKSYFLALPVVVKAMMCESFNIFWALRFYNSSFLLYWTVYCSISLFRLFMYG